VTTARSLAVWAFTWLYMLAAGMVSLPWLLISRRLDFTYALARLGIRGLLAIAGIRITVTGREHLASAGARARLYMANHQSNLDPPILLSLLPGEIAFLAKRELFRVPLLGILLRVGRLVPVDRANREAARASIASAAEAVRGGRPFLIFPEGSRSPSRQLLEFKKGPFYLAEHSGADVIPVAIQGSGDCMPKGQWRIRPGRVQVQVLAPIAPEAWASSADPRATLAALVREHLSAAVRR